MGRGIGWIPPSEGRYKVNWEVFKTKKSQAWYVGVLAHQSTYMCLFSGFFGVIFEGPQVRFLDVVFMSQVEASVENIWAEDVWSLAQTFQ